MEMARTRLEDFYAGCLVAYAGTLPQWSVPLLSSSSFLELKWSVLMTGLVCRKAEALTNTLRWLT
jgi:hypothetical protein